MSGNIKEPDELKLKTDSGTTTTDPKWRLVVEYHGDKFEQKKSNFESTNRKYKSIEIGTPG